MRVPAIFLAMSVGLFSQAIAQTPPTRTFDSVTGEYVVRYYSYEFGKDTVVRFEPLNRVAPSLTLDSIASDAGPSLIYAYALANAATSQTTQSIGNVEMPCSVGATASAPPGWLAYTGGEGGVADGGPFCKFLHNDGVSPGAATQGLIVQTSWLPDVREVGTRALDQIIQWPDRQEHDENVHDLIQEIIGFNGQWAYAPGPVPILDPATVDVSVLQSQLSAVCTDPLWIDDVVLCDQLADSLDAAEARLAGSNFPGATAALEGVLTTLEDDREPAGPIEGNAYWLLKINTEHVLGTIPGGPIVSPVTAGTYLRQGNPNQNQGAETILSLRASGRHRALLYVDLPTVTGPVASARIEFDIALNAENWGTAGRTVDAHRMLIAWTEGGATWNCPNDTNTSNSSANCPGAGWEMFSLNPPPYLASASGSLLVTNALMGTVSIDVTSDVQGMLSGQLTNHGWILRKTDEGAEGRLEIASSEAASGPRLVIDMGAP